MAIRTTVEEKDAKHMRCAMNPLEICEGQACMAWMEEEIRVGEEPRMSPIAPPVGKYAKSGKGYCGMVKG